MAGPMIRNLFWLEGCGYPSPGLITDRAVIDALVTSYIHMTQNSPRAVADPLSFGAMVDPLRTRRDYTSIARAVLLVPPDD